MTIIGDNRDRLAVVPSDHAGNRRPTFWFKRDAIADFKLEHLRVCAHLMQEPQAFDDSVVEVDELGFGQFIDVNFHRDILADAKRLANAPMAFCDA